LVAELDYDGSMLVFVASAQNEPEAEMICARLSDAGITAICKRDIGADVPQLGSSGSRDVYVEQELASRALEVLSVAEFSDEELAELSDAAGRAAGGESSPSPTDSP
jgi:hypothetical protein